MSEELNGMKRTGYCEDFTEKDIGKEVIIMGWVQRSRNLGGLIFTDVRDRSGLMQCVFDMNTQSCSEELFKKAALLKNEYAIGIRGRIRARSMPNPKIPTGYIEVESSELKIFAESDTPPFEITEDSQVNDMLRLKYRYLDLRRPDMQRILLLRHRIAQSARRFYDENGFIEIETPLLTKSTPEGARDYLVPSRIYPGKFFALPQSPQQYKQLLMLAGFDRYFQITKCLRDEDLRADRQPEFTQIDLEMSFVEADDVMKINEKFITQLFRDVLGVELPTPFRRITWKEAMERYGSDKPDLRFGFEIVNISDAVKGSGFKVFEGAIEAGGSVRAIKIEGGAEKFTRKGIDSLTEFVKTYKAGGLAWIKLLAGEKTSSFAKFVQPETINAITEKTGASDGDIIFIVSDAKNEIVLNSLGSLRCEIAKRLELTDPSDYKFAWVTEFPLYEYDEEENRFVAMHHPFTAPMDEDVEMLDTDPAKVRAKAYDIVLNGYELGGGSIRIHSSEMQQKMFKTMNFSEEDIKSRFGHLIEAFRYGAPPHGGLAFGLDRIVMLMAHRNNLRDVIAFPKVQNSSEPMMGSPDVVEQKQTDELGITFIKKEN